MGAAVAVYVSPACPGTLFALGRVAIPSLVKYTTALKHQNMHRTVRRAIICGTAVPAIVYLLFVLGITGASHQVSEDAISGLIGNVSQPFLIAIAIFGLFALWSSYIVVGYDVAGILEHDFKAPRSVQLLLVVVAPFALFVFGLRNFIELIGFVGGIFLALEGIIVTAMWYRANRKLRSSSLLMRGVPQILIVLGTLTFFAALAYQILPKY